MNTHFLLFFLLFCRFTFSQTLSPEALKVKTAFENLSADDNSKRVQRIYIAAFPSNTKTFLNVFHPEKFDQLYTGSFKYLEAFEKCSTNFPKKVLNKCIDIGKNLVWDADAVGQLQHISVRLSVKFLSIFVNKYKSLTNEEQEKLITFYADVENFDHYSEFQELIDKLNNIGETDIANKLISGRTLRKSNRDH